MADMNVITVRPKLFWLIMVIAILALVVGVPGVLVAIFIENPIVTKAVLYGIALLWMLGFVLTIVYWIRQLLGRYKGIRAQSIKDQVW